MPIYEQNISIYILEHEAISNKIRCNTSTKVELNISGLISQDTENIKIMTYDAGKLHLRMESP